MAEDPVLRDDAPEDILAGLSLEQLMDIEITTVSKKEQKLSEAASAVSIITGDDIRRSGLTSIPEALRLVLGMEVAKIDSHTWAISSRGFLEQFANKLLVMIDGRSVYTPLFSGVFWDTQVTFMEDIDRIEVVRGPGATLWGANAVNGVVNIITKSARETQGLVVTGGAGNEELGFGGFRYGGKIQEDLHYRVYGKYFDRDDSVLFGTDDPANDNWDMAQGGLRTDWEPNEQNQLTLQGDAYYGSENQTYFLPTPLAPFQETVRDAIHVSGGNVLGRWTHVFSDTSNLELQGYVDRTRRESVLIEELRHTFDLDLQHFFSLGERNNIIWGLGYRMSRDELDNGNYTLSFDPETRNTQLYSGFLQDEIALVHDKLKLTLGSKFEHNDYTGFEVQPSVRLAWLATDRQTVWASVSRAVRTPSRAANDIRLTLEQQPGAPSTAIVLTGNSLFDSEELWAYELGYRLRPHDRVSLDVAGFFNDYDDLRQFEFGTPFLATDPAPHIVAPLIYENNMSGQTYGVELGAQFQATEWWRLRAAYSYLNAQLHLPSSSTDPFSMDDEGENPHHQVWLRSSMDLPFNIQLDLMGRFVDNVPSRGVPSYFAFDARVAWRPCPHVEVSIVGQNLLDPQHPESAPDAIRIPQTEVQRSVYAQLTIRY